MLKLLYICGADRSGSTLLSTLMNRAQSTVAVGEMTRFLWKKGFVANEMCGCGQEFSECRFWQNIIARAFMGGKTPDAQEMIKTQEFVENHRSLPFHLFSVRRGGTRRMQAHVRTFLENMDSIIKAIGDETGAGLIVDSSKISSYPWVLSELRMAQLYVVHLVRDSRAVAYSFQRRKLRRGKNEDPLYMRMRTARDSAGYWIRMNMGSGLLRFTETPYLLVRYEDLASSNEDTIRRIQEFVGMNDAAHPEPEFEREKTAHIVSGNPVRFDKTLEPCLDTEWQAALKPKDYWRVTALTLPLLAFYGYPIKRRHLYRLPPGTKGSLKKT